MDGNIVAQLFPGIASLMVQDTTIAIARIALIAFGFILAYLGFKRTLEPLIMVPMGIGMICINCGVLFLDGGKLGTLFLDPLVSDPAKLVDIMQINILQPIYNVTFSNSLVACVVFMGVGAMCEIGFILGNPWTSIIIAIFAECGTFVTLVLGVHLGLTPPEAAAVASIGGADGPMVLFTSLMLAPHLFVPISVIAYLYLSLTYAGYPWLLKMLVPKALRGKDIMFYAPEVPKSKKFIFILVCCALLCLLFATVASAAGSGDVASAVESTWTTASTQIKTVVDNVVFPVIDMVLAIAFFVKLGTAYFDYRKSGQFEWTAPAILFACLVFTLTAPTYIWGIVGL